VGYVEDKAAGRVTLELVNEIPEDPNPKSYIRVKEKRFSKFTGAEVSPSTYNTTLEELNSKKDLLEAELVDLETKIVDVSALLNPKTPS